MSNVKAQISNEIQNPNPEVYLHRTNHPRWTREELPEEGMGVAFFKNSVEYIRDHLI
jgi:phosphoribosylformylglycinamidine synthase subunit PurQ / glutaminase